MKINLFLCACAFAAISASAAGKAIVGAVPQSPILITSDLHIIEGGVSKTVKGPWFKFGVNIQNETLDPISIVALRVEVQGADKHGNAVARTRDFDPGQSNYSGPSFSCAYQDFGQFDSENPVPRNLHLTSLAPECKGGDIWFYMSVEGFDVSNKALTVKIQPLGWYGTLDNPLTRFDEFTTISTQ